MQHQIVRQRQVMMIRPREWFGWNDNFLLVSYGSDTIILMGTVQKEEVIVFLLEIGFGLLEVTTELAGEA